MTYKLIPTLILVFILNVSYSQYTIGDVKYSVLEPDVFIPLNTGFILMDGGASIRSDTTFRNSQLHLNSKYKFATLPDARGVFIRGYIKENNAVDPFFNETGRERKVGELQSDAIQQHSHAPIGENFITNKNNVPGNTVVQGNYESVQNTQKTGGVMDARSANETRPKNIALYIYIKVN
jgi:hypothetical protein